MAIAKQWMTDFQIISYGNQGPFRPEHARDIHLEQVRWLEEKLAERVKEPTVVVTHHLPHRRSVHPKYEGDSLNPAFVSNLDHIVRTPVSLWIHGHTHESMDYVVNGTRVVCNPRGYLPGEPNPHFDPALVIELPCTTTGLRGHADRALESS
jgi:Icc-related predicted phosphoesterase